MSEEILAQESEETAEEEVVEPSEQDSSDDLTEEEVEEGKTAKGQVRWYTSGGFLNIENEADEKMAVSCTVFKAKK